MTIRTLPFHTAAALGAGLHLLLAFTDANLRYSVWPLDTPNASPSLAVSYLLSVLAIAIALVPGLVAGVLASDRPVWCGLLAAFAGSFLASLVNYGISLPLDASGFTLLWVAFNAAFAMPYGAVAGAAGAVLRARLA